MSISAAAANAYTPLECLLLFQSLEAYGTDDEVFEKISELLNNTPLVVEGPTYDAQRLSADSLRAQYLLLLHDELKAEEQETQEDGTQPGSKKRKLQSPPLPSIKDAQQYQVKIPYFVERMYARYKDYMVRAILEDERKYAAVQKEIDEIERGEWDEKIIEEARESANATKSNTVSAEPSQPIEEPRETNGTASTEVEEPKPAEVIQPEIIKEVATATPTKVSPPPAPSPQPEVQPESRPEGPPINDVLNSQSQTPVPSSPQVNQQPPNGAKNVRPSLDTQRPGSNGTAVQHAPPPLQPSPQQYKWEPSYGPPHAAQYQPGPYPPQFSSPQYPQGYGPLRGPFPPQGLPPPHPHVPSSPSPLNTQHPVQLPPPNAPGRSPSASGMPLDALADLAGQQYRANPASPMMQQGPPPGTYPYPPQHGPSPVNGPAQYHQYPPNFPAPQQQYQQFPPPQNQQRMPYAPRPELIAPENKPYTSPYNAGQAPKGPKPFSQTPRAGPSQPNTPLSRGLPRLITGSGTRWTPNPTPTTPRPNIEIQPPPVEPLSPVQKPTKPKSTKKSAPQKETQKKEPQKEPQMSEPAKAVKPPRRTGQRNRAGSTASSVIAGSHRSQSVMSHADELSMENEPPRHVKEEVATPIGVEDVGDTTADESSALPRHSTRTGPSPRQTGKRKRDESEARAPSTPATHVLWTRAFQKISVSALDAVSGHKNASTFGAPVKERDAPGYKHLILRPQDLKSIRTAINAGHRAAVAAAPGDLHPNQLSVWLPISEDLIPPKGIINNEQMEKELMRMFANAIMFNPDPKRGFGGRWNIGKGRGEGVGFEIDEDGIVKDTKEMFYDVQEIITGLRNAERRSEDIREASATAREEEMDELAGDGEEYAGNTGTVKRRRKV